MSELGLQGKTLKHKHLSNGKTQVLIEIETAKYPRALELVILKGQPLGVAPMMYQPAIYGKEAGALMQSEFFDNRELYYNVGSDAQYQKWCKEPNLCTHTGYQGREGDEIQYCHFRDCNDCGVGNKPDFSGIPMLRSSHGLQTNNGYSAVGGKDWFKDQAKASVRKWAKERLLERLGYEDWNQVPPKELFNWASDIGVEVLAGLPEEYQFEELKNVV